MLDLQDLIRSNSQKTLRWSAAAHFYTQQLQTMDSTISALGVEALNLSAAEKVFSDTIAFCSAETKASIEAFLSLSLQQIFDNPDVKIELLQEGKRDRVETKVILHEGSISGPPSRVAGGGMQNVIGFLIRFLALRRMNLQPIMVLDEAFRNVSANHLDRLCSFLLHLTKDHSLNILLVTHEPKFMTIANAVYEVRKTSEGLKVLTHKVNTPVEPT